MRGWIAGVKRGGEAVGAEAAAEVKNYLSG